MKKIALLIAVLFVIPSVLAVDTVINVRTLTDQKVSIFVLDPEAVYQLLDSFHLNVDSSGVVSATYTGEQDEIKINVKVSQNGEKLLLEEFGTFDTGQTLYLQAIPGEISSNYNELDAANEKPVEEIIEEEVELEEPTEVSEESIIASEDAPITGEVVSNDKGGIGIPVYIYFIALGVFLVFVIVAIVLKIGSVRRRNQGKSFSFIKSKKIGEEGDKNMYRGESQASSEEIEEAEKKIKEAQAEINRIKNKEKIKEIEKKLEQDKEELEKLRGSD